MVKLQALELDFPLGRFVARGARGGRNLLAFNRRRDGVIRHGSSACSSSTGMRTPRTRPERSASSTTRNVVSAESWGKDDKKAH